MQKNVEVTTTPLVAWRLNRFSNGLESKNFVPMQVMYDHYDCKNVLAFLHGKSINSARALS